MSMYPQYKKKGGEAMFLFNFKENGYFNLF